MADSGWERREEGQKVGKVNEKKNVLERPLSSWRTFSIYKIPR
jgi:hypothetical protein